MNSIKKCISRLNLILAGLLVATSAVVSTLSPSLVSAYSVSGGANFNNPYGSSSEKWAVINKIGAAIDNAPAGSVIRVAVYSLTMDEMADKFIKAYERGVNVRIVTDDHIFGEGGHDASGDQIKRIQSKIGADVTKSSYLKICKDGCMSTIDGTSVHAKVYLFSTSGTSKQVTMIGSSNLSYTHTNSWNNMFTTIGDATLYDNMRNYIDAMAKEPDTPDWYSVVTSGNYRQYTFPRAGVDTNDEDIYWGILNTVSCSGAASGYGSSGKTVIDVAMFSWTEPRLNVATKLRQLSDSGCKVRIAANKTGYHVSVLEALMKPINGKASTIQIKDMEKNFVNGKPVNYSHHKYLTINGNYGDKADSKLVFTGSPNLTSYGMRQNNEVLIRVYTSATHTSYTANFNTMWSKGRTMTWSEIDAM